MARINFELKNGIHKRFVDRCRKDGRTVTDVLRGLILGFVEKRIREEGELETLNGDKDGRSKVGGS